MQVDPHPTSLRLHLSPGSSDVQRGHERSFDDDWREVETLWRIVFQSEP
jgi:hypothetical protein